MSALGALVTHTDLSQHSGGRGVPREMAGKDTVQSEGFESILGQRSCGFRGITVSSVRNADTVAEFGAAVFAFNPQPHAAAEDVSVTEDNGQVQARATRL